MKKRTGAVSIAVIAALLAGGGAFWLLRDQGDQSQRPTASTSTPSDSSEPDSAESPPPEDPGRPVAACAKDPGSRAIPDRYWGMHVTNPVGSEFPDAPIEAVNLTTAQVYWNQIELAPGQYSFGRMDQILQTSRERGARPMLVLGFTPTFHARDPASPTARATMPDLDAWRAWVSTVVARYGNQIDYQIWPEPNIVSNWEDSPAQMARLTAMASGIIRKSARDALVVAPATTLRMKSQQKWMDRYWATEVDGRPVADTVDAVALDPFPLEEGTPEDSLALLCRALEILDDNAVDLPVWTNEINYGVPSGGPSTGVAPYSDARQAAVVARTYVLHASLGVERVYWLGWFSYPGLAVEMSRDGVTTPAGQAYMRAHEWLAGGSVPECSILEGTHICESRRAGVTTSIMWRVKGVTSVKAPSAGKLTTLDGQSRSVSRGDRIRVGQSPVALIQRG